MGQCYESRSQLSHKDAVIDSGSFFVSGGFMAQDFARHFYRSQAWQLCRDSYIRSRQGLCERCLANGLISAGKIVHHRSYLTADNIGNPAISLNPDNLELLCQDCHNAEHNQRTPTRYTVDAAGNVSPRRR